MRDTYTVIRWPVALIACPRTRSAASSQRRTIFSRPMRATWTRGTLVTSRPFPSFVSTTIDPRSEEHTSELQSHSDLVCRLLLEKKKRSLEHFDKTLTAWPSNYRYNASIHHRF